MLQPCLHKKENTYFYPAYMLSYAARLLKKKKKIGYLALSEKSVLALSCTESRIIPAIFYIVIKIIYAKKK